MKNERNDGRPSCPHCGARSYSLHAPYLCFDCDEGPTEATVETGWFVLIPGLAPIGPWGREDDAASFAALHKGHGRETVNAIDAAFEASAEQYRLLAHRDIHQADVLRYVKIVFSLPDKLTRQAERMVREIEQAVEAGLGNTAPEVRGTWWAAYNGVSEYLSYRRGRSADCRPNNLWFGAGANLCKLALDTALEMAAA